MKSNKILIVEDDDRTRSNLNLILKENGYNVCIAENGKIGFEIAFNELPDLIISDLMMPEADGFELQQLLKADPKTEKIPVIFLTARTEEKDINQALKNGAIDFITKPFKAKLLLNVIEKYLEKSEIETKLNLSEARFEAIFKSNAVPIAFFNSKNEIVEANDKFLNILQFKKDELTDGKINFFDLIDKDYSEVMNKVAEEFEKIGVMTPAEIKLYKKSGQSIWASIAGGKLSGTDLNFLVFIDITERKQAEEEVFRLNEELERKVFDRTSQLNDALEEFKWEVEERKRIEIALRESEEKYRGMIENIQDGIFIIQNMKMVFINEILANIVGYTVDEMLNTEFTNYIAPEDTDMVINRYYLRMKGDSVDKEMEFRLLHRDGVTRIIVNMKSSLVTFMGIPSSLGTIANITKRKKAEEDLKISEEKYRNLVENMNDVIFTIGIDGNCWYISPSAKNIFGYNLDELIGQNIFKYVHPDDLERILREVSENLSGNAYPSEFRLIKRNNDVIYIRSSSKVVYSDGLPIAFSGVMNDITEKKKAEIALSDSEKKFRRVIEQSTDGILITDEKGNIIEWNLSLEKMLKTKKDEIIGKELADVFLSYVKENDEEFVKRIRNTVNDYLKFGTSSQFSTIIERVLSIKDMNEIFVQIIISPIKTEKGFMICAIIRDITDFMKAKEEIENSNKFLETLLDTIPNPIFYKDKNLFFDSGNKTFAEQVLGNSKHTIKGKTNHDFFGRDSWDFVEFCDNTDKELIIDDTPQTYEARIKCADELERDFQFNKAAFKDIHGEFAGIVGVMTDITARKQDEMELKKYAEDLIFAKASIEEHGKELAAMVAELEKANEEKNGLMSITAHDLKNPISGIVGFLNLLDMYDKSLDQKERKEIINSAKRAASTAFQIINELMDIHAFEEGKTKIYLTDVNMNELVVGIIDSFQQNASNKGIKINTDIMPEKGMINADKVKLQRVIDNLISNALKFSPFNKNVWIKLEKVEYEDNEKKSIRLIVKDEGQGLSEKDMEKLFTKFARLSARPTGNETSTGLGLSIVRLFTQSMNGKVWCESVKGEGATFYLEFPEL